MSGAALWGRGSLLWLIGHELRLAWRDGQRAGLALRLLVLLILLLVPVLGGVALALWLHSVPDVPPDALGFVNAAAVALLLMMTSGASVHVLRCFHERADLDLLLASPLPPARVLAAKSVAVHLSVALPLLVLTGPFVIASVLVGHPGWIGGTLVILVNAVLASSLAFVIAGLLFRRLGARRARMVLQIGGGLFAALVGVLSQSATFAPIWFDSVLARLRPVPAPPFDLPVRAVFGEPLALLPLAALALLAAVAAARLAAATLVGSDVHEAVTSRRGRTRFRQGPMRLLLGKELRLLWRDPELLSAMLLQLAYMLPAFGLIFGGGRVSPGRLAAAAVLFAGLLAASLGWLTICGEDAPDLIAAAPVSPGRVRRAKLLAACLPPLAIVLVPIAIIAATAPRAALVAARMAPLAALAAVLQQGWAAVPQRRRAFGSRQRGSLLLALAEYGVAGGLASATSLLVLGSPLALAGAGVAAVILLLTWSTRVRAPA